VANAAQKSNDLKEILQSSLLEAKIHHLGIIMGGRKKKKERNEIKIKMQKGSLGLPSTLCVNFIFVVVFGWLVGSIGVLVKMSGHC